MAKVADDEAIIETLYTSLHPFDCLCAWCLAEAEEQPHAEDSHGICQFHREEIYAAYQESRQLRRAG